MNYMIDADNGSHCMSPYHSGCDKCILEYTTAVYCHIHEGEIDEGDVIYINHTAVCKYCIIFGDSDDEVINLYNK